MKRRTLLKSGAPILIASIAGCTASTESNMVSAETTEADILEESAVFANADYFGSELVITTDQYPRVNDMSSQPVHHLTVADPDGRKVARTEVYYGVTQYRFPIDTLQDGTYRVVATFSNDDGDVAAEALLLEVGVGGVTILGTEVHD